MYLRIPMIPAELAGVWAAANGFLLGWGLFAARYRNRSAPVAIIILAILNCMYEPPWAPGLLWGIWSAIFSGVCVFVAVREIQPDRMALCWIAALGMVTLNLLCWSRRAVSPCDVMPDTVFRMGYYAVVIIFTLNNTDNK